MFYFLKVFPPNSLALGWGFVYPSCGCMIAMPTYWLFCMRRLCKASSRTIVMHCWEKFDYFCNSFAIFAMSSKWWHSSHHWLWTARAHHWFISTFEITWVALIQATVGCIKWKARGLFNCYSSHLMHVDGWRKERYYFSKVFRPSSLDSLQWCKRALQVYGFSVVECRYYLQMVLCAFKLNTIIIRACFQTTLRCQPSQTHHVTFFTVRLQLGASLR